MKIHTAFETLVGPALQMSWVIIARVCQKAGIQIVCPLRDKRTVRYSVDRYTVRCATCYLVGISALYIMTGVLAACSSTSESAQLSNTPLWQAQEKLQQLGVVGCPQSRDWVPTRNR